MGHLLEESDAFLRRIAADHSLLDEARFSERAAVLDQLEFDILDRLHDPVAKPGGTGSRPLLREIVSRAEAVRDRLEAVDKILFDRVRRDIRAGLRGVALRRAIGRYVEVPSSREPRRGYDDLDEFVAGLLLPPPVPVASRTLEPGMVFYQPTPARVILEMSERIGAGHRFVDIGSGLGLVPILVHLLTGAGTLGIEVDPSYHAYASGRAHELGIADRVTFVELDARSAEYAEADVIFLYTPFQGDMLDDVLARLRGHCQPGTRIFSYGPCTPILASQAWLEPLSRVGSPDLLAMFELSGHPST